MMTVTPSERKNTKLKFFSAYIFSVALILVIFVFIWQGDSAASPPAKTLYTTPSNEAYVQADTYLHKRMLELNNVYLTFMSNGDTSMEKITLAESAFRSGLDSIQKEVSGVQDIGQKKEWDLLLESFRRVMQNSRMISNSAQSQTYITGTDGVKTDLQNSADNDVTVERLKKMLLQKEEQIAFLERRNQTAIAEKEKSIVSLQNQLNQMNGSALPKTTEVATEWKQKFINMKSRHSELNTSYNSLSQAYQNVVADNRRLLNQLQLMKKQ